MTEGEQRDTPHIGSLGRSRFGADAWFDELDGCHGSEIPHIPWSHGGKLEGVPVTPTRGNRHGLLSLT